MGIWWNGVTGERVMLRASHIFGRNSKRADTHLTDPGASRLHAEVRWRDGAWCITDHSRNGTAVGGRVLTKGQWTRLHAGEVVHFGPSECDDWKVVDVAPPTTSLVPLDPTRAPITLAPSNLLPNGDGPELPVYRSHRGEWLVETPCETRPLVDGELLTLGGHSYRVFIADNVDDTVAAGSPLSEPPLLNFRVSADEEHTYLRVCRGGLSVDLGERSHHYCLVTLARRRLSDMRAGVDRSQQGWIGCAELAAMLRVGLQYLNIQVHRARHQLMSALPSGSELAHVIERQRGCLRIGEIAFEITRGLELEGYYAPDGEREEAAAR